MSLIHFQRILIFLFVAASLTSCSEIKKEYRELGRLSAKMDAAQARKNKQAAASAQEEENEKAEEGEVKEIGYAYNHRNDVDNEDSDKGSASPAARETVQEDAIETVDNNNGWLTIRYVSGKDLGTGLGIRKDWFFAYSSHFIVLHNERNECVVRDIHNNTLVDGTTRNMDGDCTGLRVVGDRIIIDVDTGHSTRQETYDMNLSLVRTSNEQMY